jgi:acetyl-CoA carboxylase biotin carboxylase subunit
MFSKVLIANRGEIAVRVIRACREMDIRTVAVHSEADRHCLHTLMADERRCIGPAMSSKSYLDAQTILRAAQETGAQAIHPGYGYLAESEAFARACRDARIVFIGPTPQNLRLAGDKVAAKEAMRAAGVPVIPSGEGAIPGVEEALALGKRIGYPVMIKAAGGGGGRGIRVCGDASALMEEFAIARSEARASFGDDRVYIEKRIDAPRHIEFQILADRAGRVIHLGERECTIQRRYQKLIEESPSPRLSPRLREQMARAAIAAARAIDYFNAGTVEFLVDPEDRFYFMEINARIQVEHPVTEVVTGVDLIKEQIRLAAGGHLAASLEGLSPNGWAMECRINAEDPERGFLPSPGTVETYRPPGGFGVRLDTHLYPGYELPMYYDSLIGKLIAHDRTREGAIRIMKRALGEFLIHPLKTTIPLHLRVMDDPDFRSGVYTTDFIRRFLPPDEEDHDS